MFKKIVSIETKENFILIAIFESGETKEYDIKPLFDKIASFRDLKNINGLFNQVKVDIGGYGIVWNDYIDLSSDEIYYNGKCVNI